MSKNNSISANLPYGSAKKIGEIAGKALGRKNPINHFHVSRCISAYPVCPWKNETVYLAVINAALQVIDEYNKTKNKTKAAIEKKVAALPKHTMALTPVE